MYQLTVRWGLINQEATSYNTYQAAHERGHYLTARGGLCYITHPNGRREDIDWLTRS